MKELSEFLKSIVRPAIIMSSWLTILYMWVYGIDVPELLVGVAVAIIGEYVGERAVKRFKEGKDVA